MFSYILKILPQLDQASLKKMEATLAGRFQKLAKGFGKGLANALKGGGIAGIALGLVDKLLNPIKEVQEAIDRMLTSSDDIATNAQQFNTSTGRLYKLVQLGKSTGLDQDNLFQLITKFQTAVAEAKADPSQPSAVRNFTNQPDTVQGFFEFIQALQQMEKNQQVLVQQQVFGEKQILRMADFLQTDFGKQVEALGYDKISSEKIAQSIDKLGALNDLQDVLKARRETDDLFAKSRSINEGTIRARDKSERLALEKENQQIASYENLAAISDTVTKIMGLVQTGLDLLGGTIKTVTPILNNLVKQVQTLANSPLVRGIFGGKGK